MTELTFEDLEPAAEDKTIMSFGKYRGEELGDVPASYLLWAFGERWFREDHPGLWKYVDRHKRHLVVESERESPEWEDCDYPY